MADTERGRMIRRVLIIGGSALFVLSSVTAVVIIGLQNTDQAGPAVNASSEPGADVGEEPFPDDADEAPSEGDTPGLEPIPGQLSVEQARDLLQDYAAANPDLAEDFLAIEDVIDDQIVVIDQMESEVTQLEDEVHDLKQEIAGAGADTVPVVTRTNTAPDAAANVTIVVSIAGAITGAVAAVAGVVSAMAAMGYRRAGGAPPTAAA